MEARVFGPGHSKGQQLMHQQLAFKLPGDGQQACDPPNVSAFHSDGAGCVLTAAQLCWRLSCLPACRSMAIMCIATLTKLLGHALPQLGCVNEAAAHPD